MRLWQLMILREMMFEVVIGVLVMEVDKVTDEVTDWWWTWMLTGWLNRWLTWKLVSCRLSVEASWHKLHAADIDIWKDSLPWLMTHWDQDTKYLYSASKNIALCTNFLFPYCCDMRPHKNTCTQQLLPRVFALQSPKTSRKTVLLSHRSFQSPTIHT